MYLPLSFLSPDICYSKLTRDEFHPVFIKRAPLYPDFYQSLHSQSMILLGSFQILTIRKKDSIEQSHYQSRWCFAMFREKLPKNPSRPFDLHVDALTRSFFFRSVGAGIFAVD